MRKVVKIIFLISLIIIMLCTTTYAVDLGEIMQSADDFIDAKDKYEHSKVDESKIIDALDFIFNILVTIGVVVVMIVFSILGIKFMISSVEEQAKIKESLIPFVVGCVIIFGAFGIWKLATGILNNVTSTSKIVTIQNDSIKNA